VKDVRKNPCASCPYRRDVPSGIWAREEYDKLVRYDAPTGEQPTQAFACHQPAEQGKTLCAGWVAVHGTELLALRLGVAFYQISDEVFDYSTRVPLWKSGAEAREHGLRDLDSPSEQALRLQNKITKKRGSTT
jgi:hypothetical protein